MTEINLIVVTGPTASGKTGFATHLAHRMNGEIISADSRQVYREMNLGTGKDYDDYIVDGVPVPYHLIDIKEPGYKYNVYEFQQDFVRVFDEIAARGKMPFLVGGTGMYVEAVTQGYNLVPVPANEQLRQELNTMDQQDLVSMLKSIKPELHNTTDIGHKKRTIRAIEIATYYAEHKTEEFVVPDIRPVIIGVKYDRDSRRKRISERLRSRLNEGMIEEVEGLLTKVAAEDLIFYGLEYKYITMFLIGRMTRDEMVKKLEIAIHQFAKRQMTWFRKMERDGVKIHWLDGQMTMEEKLARAEIILKKYDPGLIN
jgi:tRNA dimethylallyltransferase